jgi:hypothetical protein
MRSTLVTQIIASGIGMALLFLLVTSATYLFVPQEGFAATVLIWNGVAALTAVATWTGVLFSRKKEERTDQPQSWTEWVGLFLISLPLSGLFVLIDCGWHLPPGLGGTTCNGHPGISLIFTIAAVALSAIALPSALRAWLLQRLTPTPRSDP